MSRKLSLPLLLAAVIAISSGCSRKAEIARARKLEQQGQPSRALEIYKAQFATTPEYQKSQRADLQYHVGECLLAMGRTREAFSAYSHAVDIDDSHQLAHLRLGQMYLMSGSGENATQQAQQALNKSEASLDALALLGQAASANGNLDVAQKAFETVLAKDPTRIKVALSYAEMLTQQGEPDRAREVLQKIAQANGIGVGLIWNASAGLRTMLSRNFIRVRFERGLCCGRRSRRRFARLQQSHP